MSLQNIPQELRALPQWVCAGTNKQPLNPRTGQPASVIDPTTWGTFEEAMHCGYLHIGFVLSMDDPYSIIDLDDPSQKKINSIQIQNTNETEVEELRQFQRQILDAFPSYAEYSQSGKGVHIIVRGGIGQGVRKHKVEVYSCGRYMICTGKILKPLPITEQQPLLTMLAETLSEDDSKKSDLIQIESHVSDDDLREMAAIAKNSDKFEMLWAGDWQTDYESQSEADFALLAMLAFYTKDNEQVRRVFRLSALGQREKATKNDNYLNRALTKIRGRELPDIDFSTLITKQNEFPASIQQKLVRNEQSLLLLQEPAKGNGVPRCDNKSVSFPSGFVGELAEYIHSSAIRPVREIALCASIALTAGVIGRTFNISGTGLNQYLIMLAKTGSGKEGAATGIDSMVSATRLQIPLIDEFIGPSAFASGQALIRVLDQHPCFVSVLGEFGLTLQQLCSPHANAAQIMLKKVLLDIYAKSGQSKVLRSSVYSDSDKNTKAIRAPNVTILGESTPETFYSNIDAGSIAEGLIPRFSIFEYTGPRPPSNPNAFHAPSEALIRAFAALASTATASEQNRQCVPVQQDAYSLNLFKEFDSYCDDEINNSSADIAKQLWNRAHLKALKLAALLSAGANPYQPIISQSSADWAIELVSQDIKKLLAKFDVGEVGTGDVRLELDVRRAIEAYFKMSAWDRQSYGTPKKMQTLDLVPLNFLRRRVRQLVGFKTDRRGATKALSDTIDALCEAGTLVRINPIQAREQCGTSSPVFGTGENWVPTE